MDDERYQYLFSEYSTNPVQEDWNDIEMVETEPQVWEQELWCSPSVQGCGSRWLQIVELGSCESLSFNEVPWPTLIPITTPSDIILDQVKAFVELPRGDMSAYDVISQELLRWRAWISSISAFFVL